MSALQQRAAAARVDAPAPAAPPLASRWPRHEEDEIDAVVAVLRAGRTNGLVHGERCRAFEAAFATYCGAPYALALANGTVALEIALAALGIGPGDEVIVTPRSFFASAGCVVARGAIPVFADVDPVSQNLTAATIARALTPRTRAVIPVHLAGWPCAMPEIMALAEHCGLKVIEDCAQAHGATLDGRVLGSFGDAAAFSFCTDKIMSTGGEGGLLLVRDAGVYERAWSLKDHGKNRAAMARPAAGRGFRYLHDGFGSNHRMTEAQAAIGLVQLGKLAGWLAARRARAARLDAILGGLPALRLAVPSPGTGHAYYKYYAFVRPERLRAGWSRDRIVEVVADHGVPCFTGACPEIYRERAFLAAGIGPDRPLPVARELGETSLMLPVDPTLSLAEVTRMGEALRDVVVAETGAE